MKWATTTVGCQDDGGEAARDMALSPGDQRERDKVVEKSHDEKRPPNRRTCGHELADNPKNQMQPERGDPDAQENYGESRQLVHRDVDEIERAAPKNGEDQQHAPFPGPHRKIDRRAQMNALPLRIPQATCRRGGGATRFLRAPSEMPYAGYPETRNRGEAS